MVVLVRQLLNEAPQLLSATRLLAGSTNGMPEGTFVDSHLFAGTQYQYSLYVASDTSATVWPVGTVPHETADSSGSGSNSNRRAMRGAVSAVSRGLGSSKGVGYGVGVGGIIVEPADAQVAALVAGIGPSLQQQAQAPAVSKSGNRVGHVVTRQQYFATKYVNTSSSYLALQPPEDYEVHSHQLHSMRLTVAFHKGCFKAAEAAESSSGSTDGAGEGGDEERRRLARVDMAQSWGSGTPTARDGGQPQQQPKTQEERQALRAAASGGRLRRSEEGEHHLPGGNPDFITRADAAKFALLEARNWHRVWSLFGRFPIDEYRVVVHPEGGLITENELGECV